MITGIDALHLKNFSALRKRRVALLSHQAAATRSGATSAQLLHQVLGRNLVALFGPEHGFFGQATAGEKTYTCPHPDWSIPVYSLYGECRQPTPEMLHGVDLLLVDLQDLGVRCYTYLATLRLTLLACARAHVAVCVADRPIPLPEVVDGPLLDPVWSSFVAPCAVPLVYGMTLAEAARWLVREEKIDVDLTVAPLRAWKRGQARWDSTRPEFIPPSPGIKSWETAMTYAATVFSEALPGIDCGRNTNLSFRVLGAPWMHAETICAALEALRLPGITFHPYRYAGGVAPYQGKALDGFRITVTNPAEARPVAASLAILRTLSDLYGPTRIWRHKGVRPQWFDKLYGTDATRHALQTGTPIREIVTTWAAPQFVDSRECALLY